MKAVDLTVSYDGKKILENLSFETGDGITCLMGESGCGKTTLLNTVAGLIEPDSGEIVGAPLKPSFMFQEDRLFPWMNALENVDVVCNDRAKAMELLKKVELEEHWNKMPTELSGGMKRRVALARTLAFAGDMLILDEPFKGMDAELVKRMALLIKEVKVPVLMATHSEEEAELLGAGIQKLK
ncbi:MAG: ATP-binding cassette domain-containing protein [Lachnospiraceae bacterium]|nr:ATP-binding cassette domain-containing protein [Lachnospiraceae bacterium]